MPGDSISEPEAIQDVVVQVVPGHHVVIGSGPRPLPYSDAIAPVVVYVVSVNYILIAINLHADARTTIKLHLIPLNGVTVGVVGQRDTADGIGDNMVALDRVIVAA